MTRISPLSQPLSSSFLAIILSLALFISVTKAFHVPSTSKGPAFKSWRRCKGLDALDAVRGNNCRGDYEAFRESEQSKTDMITLSRRDALPYLLALSSSLSLPSLASAGEEAEGAATKFTRQGKGYAYEFVPPSGFKEGNKPLKTHLDEINFTKEDAPRGYQYGVTVDPVRIDSLRQFGTPEEVAARVVTAEVNRDGIFEVTLVKDPVENTDNGSYEIEYLSDGKRGKKNFVTRIFIKKNMLYVLTAQAKQENYAELEKEMLDCVKTFSVTAN